ncbi:MAG: hypothetical protein QF858_03245 [Candidatus Pacebacteria bacterium]|nr:hypothetical protein [Candidatus Paceibacterota bacterium]
MSKKAIINCSCSVEIENVNEYEALDIVNEMLKREYPLSEKTILKVNEVLTTSAEGCGVTYKEKNGNVRRDNCAEVLLERLTDERTGEALKSF